MSDQGVGDVLVIGSGPGSTSVGPLGLHVATHGASERRHEEALLFVHGAGCGSWVWENFLSYFADRGWDGAAVNWRGHPPSPAMEAEDFSDDAFHRYAGLMGEESPTALNSASRNELDVDPQRVSGPICVISADHDMMQGYNSGIDRAVARVYGAEYFQIRGFGHMFPIESGWERAAAVLERWIRKTFPA